MNRIRRHFTGYQADVALVWLAIIGFAALFWSCVGAALLLVIGAL